MKIAGLDIGTTGCKLTVFDADGTQLSKAYRDYQSCRQESRHEIDISSMMESVYEVIREMTEQISDIAAIGVTSFGETFVMTDEANKPLHKAMLYTDPRGTEECEILCEKIGGRKIALITGLRPHEMYSISKMMWLKKCRPKIYGAAKHIFLIEDFIVYNLTGIAQIDFSLAARTMAFDIQKLSWSEEIFAAAGIDSNLMSSPVPAGTVAGKLSKAASDKTGLPTECKIVSVSHDQVAAAVGAGAFDSSVAVDGAGTVQCLTPIFDGIPDVDVMYNGYFSIVPYVTPNKYVAYAFSYTGGALIQWCVDTIAKKEKELAAQQGITVNEYLENQRKNEEPTGLLILPHFAGAATPYMDTGSKGAILGLTSASSAADIYQGCMEGVAYEMYLNMNSLLNSGIRFTRLNATGGGSRSKLWMQIKANVLNLPITAMKTSDAGTVGSAMITGIAVGLFQNLEDAAEHMAQEAETYLPNKEMHEKYMRIFKRYEKLYSAVRPLM